MIGPLVRTISGSVMLFLQLSALWAFPAPAQAALVTELDFASGSIALMSGSTTVASSSFTQNPAGRILMNQYQPLPNIIPPLSLTTLVGNYTFSLFTSGPNPVPTSSTIGTTITEDLPPPRGQQTGHSTSKQPDRCRQRHRRHWRRTVQVEYQRFSTPSCRQS